MYSRVVILYLIILILDSLHGAPYKNKIKRKKSIRTGDNDQENATNQEKVDDDGDLDKTQIENQDDKNGNNSGNTQNMKADEDAENQKTNGDKNNMNDGDTQNDLDNPASGQDGQKQNKYEDMEQANEGDVKDNNKVEYRPYTIGDTFTPQELLPVTMKLRSKVETPGGGKGFVSATKSAEQLADKLFEAFFMTFKRIVTLEEPDIAGLDALQALALSGEAIENSTLSVTEPAQTKYLRGQLITLRSKPRSTIYKLMLKRTHPKRNYKNAKRRGNQMVNKLSNKKKRLGNKRRGSQAEKLKMMLKKKRRLVVNSRRHEQNKNSTMGKDSACHWRYECSDPAELDTCTLITQCANKNKPSIPDSIPLPHRSDEHSQSMIQFRKMLGITLVDEEVEKILQSRITRLQPSKLRDDERVESLSEYFNHIVMEQELATTIALSPSGNDDDTTEANNDNGSEETQRKKFKQ